jgi:3-oxoacyl-[acyl-carrier protein] reductase
MSFKDRVAVITGGGQGIGRAYALAFAESGAKVAVVDLNAARAEEVAEAVRATGGEAIAVKTDVADKRSCFAMVDAVLARFGALHILVNNAAIFSTLKMRPFDEIPEDEWNAVMNVNARGTFFCCQAVAATMKAQRYGKIINISSSVVMTGRANYGHYVASKGAVVALTRALATELGPFDVNVNAIAPHGIVTEVPRETITEDQWTGIIAAQALKRRGDTSDMVGTLLFLASDASKYITGQTLNLDAGLRYN